MTSTALDSISFIPISDLAIEERQRQAFNEKSIADLADSIAALGLLQPIVLRNDGRTLVAGETQVRALKLLSSDGHTTYPFNGDLCSISVVPAVLVADLDEAELVEAELHENLRRTALTWQEEASAIAKLHALRKSSAEAKGARQTFSSTAAELTDMLGIDIRHPDVRDAEVLAEHLDDPEVAAAKNAREARKIIDKKTSAAHRAELAKQYAGVPSQHQIYCEDSLDWLQECEAGYYDGIITDPPYGIDAHAFGDMQSTRHRYDDSADYAMECYSNLFLQGARICKPQAYLFAFCDFEHFLVLREMAKQCGWTPFRTPIIWHRGNSGMLPLPNEGPRRIYECLLYAWRGDRGLQIENPYDIVQIPAVSNPVFGAEKPAELYESLLRWRARPTDRILDPFAGSGPLLPAAKALSAYATCIEANEDKVSFMRVRLQELENGR